MIINIRNRKPKEKHPAKPRLSAVPATSPTPTSYYRYLALKAPEWQWEIVLYFFLGGLASGCYLIATLAELFGTPEDRAVSRAGRYIALAAILISPLLLIADLGRSERFTHMMRIIKTRSPMSMGTWGLSGFGLFVGLGALRQAVEDGLIDRHSILARLLAWVPLQVSGIIGTLFAFVVGSYTGVLLSFTNVPVWARNRLYQGPLFVTSAISTAVAAISLVLDMTGSAPKRTIRWLARVEDAATLGEMGLLAGSLSSLGPASRPLTRGPRGVPALAGWVVLGLIAPFLLRHSSSTADHRGRNPNRILASICVLLGGLFFRWLTVYAGRESVEKP